MSGVFDSSGGKALGGSKLCENKFAICSYVASALAAEGGYSAGGMFEFASSNPFALFDNVIKIEGSGIFENGRAGVSHCAVCLFLWYFLFGIKKKVQIDKGPTRR